MCSFFVMVVGTSYVAFAVYPVVAEVAASARVRPERAVSASVICAGIAVMASPMSAAMAAMVGIMATQGVEFHQILAVTIPTFILSLFCAALSVFWRGKELEDDPEFKARLANGDYQWLATHSTTEMKFAEARLPAVPSASSCSAFWSRFSWAPSPTCVRPGQSAKRPRFFLSRTSSRW